MKQYKVLTQYDKAFGGNFNPEKLEKALNDLSEDGWTVVAITTGDVPSGVGFGSKARQEIVIILEK